MKFSLPKTVLTLPCLLLLLAPFRLAALDTGALGVAQEELATAQSSKIAFVNYEGPQAVIESASAIKGIGASLAQAIGAPKGVSDRAGETGRYAVIRAIDPSVPEGLDADIIVIGADSLVDHIANLRRIVAGYLEGAWGYSAKDASTLAIFITVYNAVHRGDIAYIAGKYKKVVTKEVSAANAGLSTRWDEWPGKTRILIPLSSGARQGAVGAVSTATISDKAVTDDLRAQPGAAIPERQALVDIKEKEVVQGQAEAAKAQTEAKAADAALGAAKDQLAAATAALQAATAPVTATAPVAATAPQAATAPVAAIVPQATTTPQAATAAPESAATAPPAATAAQATATPADKGATETASVTVKPAEVAAAEKAVAEAQAAVTAASATAAEKSSTAAQAEAAVAAKQAEVATDRATITQDQKSGIAAEVAAAVDSEANGVYLFEVMDAGYPFARIDFVDTKTGKLLRASLLNTIRARSVVDGGAIFVAIAGKEGGTGAIRLVAIEKNTLMQTAMGETNIYAESSLVKIGDSYFATIKANDGKYYLGRFDAKLVEAARSTEAVNPLGFVKEGADGVVAQAPAGGFLVLDATSLDLLRKLGL